MSRQINTDGLMIFPPDNGEPITLNAFESIECAIAFNVRDWSEDRRSAWIYAIIFGWDYEDSWDEVAKKFGWDEEDRKRANMMHEQWIKAKHDAITLLKEQEAVEPITEHHLFLCPVCKNTLFREQKFCHECGKRINWEGR